MKQGAVQVRRFYKGIPTVCVLRLPYTELKKFYADEKYIPKTLTEKEYDFLINGTVVRASFYGEQWIHELDPLEDVLL